MKHTPGPWIAEMVENGEGTLVYGRIKEKGSRHSLAFAGVYEGHNAEANARLIAAAPELLEACQLLMEVVIDKYDIEELETAWYAAREVIAKALS